MNFNPQAWEHHRFVADGAAEDWRIDFHDGETYRCERLIYHSEDAMRETDDARSAAHQVALINQPAFDANMDVAESKFVSEQGEFNSATDAAAFFAAGRNVAMREAHDLVASVDNRVGNFAD